MANPRIWISEILIGIAIAVVYLLVTQSSAHAGPAAATMPLESLKSLSCDNMTGSVLSDGPTPSISCLQTGDNAELKVSTVETPKPSSSPGPSHTSDTSVTSSSSGTGSDSVNIDSSSDESSQSGSVTVESNNNQSSSSGGSVLNSSTSHTDITVTNH
jgi:hypothetical protein